MNSVACTALAYRLGEHAKRLSVLIGAQEVSKQRMSRQESPKPRGWVTPEGS
jgi:hypothetical protein